jgi:hypothetical protein
VEVSRAAQIQAHQRPWATEKEVAAVADGVVAEEGAGASAREMAAVVAAETAVAAVVGAASEQSTS